MLSAKIKHLLIPFLRGGNEMSKTMKNRCGTVAIMVAVICLVAGQAGATLMTIGDPWDSGSWAQRFNESNVGLYNRLEGFMISTDDTFEAPGFSGFSAAGWTGTLVTNEYIRATTGFALSNMDFNITFEDLRSDPLQFVFVAWYNDVMREAALANWSGSAWTFSAYTGDVKDLVPVPEPGTIVLLGTGLLGLCFYGRRRMQI
jgi:hypothetical protein